MLANKEYKESGVVWLGKLPAHWDVDKIGSVYTERRTIVSDEEYEPLSVTKTGIVPQLDNAAKSDAHDNRKLVVAGDFVINSRSDRKGSSGISNLDGSVSLINTVLEPRANMNNKYYNFVFKTDMFCDEFYKWGHGIVADLWTTRWTDMKNIYVPRPDLSEQKAIADYLDKGCARIDGIVTTQRQIIEKLKEYKKSVITEAVTCGLNPDAPMKDSGIEWIGDIPAHWKIGKLKRVAKFITGSTPSKTDNDKYYSDNGMLWIKPDNLMGFNFIQETAEYLNDAGVKEVKAIPPYTPLVCCIGSIGKFGWCNKEVAFNQQINAVVFDFSKVLSKYGLYYLCSQEEQHWYFANGNVVKILNSTGQGQITITLPSLSEQQAIADYLDKECARIDTIIEKRERMIELMTEYKKSLIYECVTGKKEIVDVVE